jgi:hypothetical protein
MDSSVRRDADKIVGTGQESHRRQLGWYIQERKQRIRLPEKDSRDRSARRGQDKGMAEQLG